MLLPGKAQSDDVVLLVDNMRIKHFIRYDIACDILTPASAFSLELANPEINIRKGTLCDLYVNGVKELAGVIDAVHRRIDKNGGATLSLEGRDYMGWLVDAHCEPPWEDISNIKLKALTDKLLAKAPAFVKRLSVEYESNVAGKGSAKTSASGMLAMSDTAQKITRVEAGMTIFQVLNNYARSRGLLFYCQPDGRLVFRRPLTKGMPEYTLTMKTSGAGNNVIESDVREDISRQYSKYTVIGQQQDTDDAESATDINTQASSTDADFPFYKPYVTTDNNDDQSPAKSARLLMEANRREGTQLTYTVGRHSQEGKNWAVNKMCHITDEKQSLNGSTGIDGDYLIYGRTFWMDKESGPQTIVMMGLPGVIA